MNKQPERTDATREAILDALWRLRRGRRLERISVREVSELAHVHRSTFYRYFTSVPDAFDAFEERFIDEIVACASNVAAANDGMDFASLSVAFVDALSPYAETLGILTGPAGDPAFAGKFAQRFKPVLDSAISFHGDAVFSDYLFQLSLMTILLNIGFWNEHRDSCTLEEVCSISRALMDGGVAKVVASASEVRNMSHESLGLTCVKISDTQTREIMPL